MKTIKIGVNVILQNEDKKILLGKRKNIYGDGTWGLPGGHLNYGEKLNQAAARELAEETGIQLNPKALSCLGINNQFNHQDDGSVDQYLQICFFASANQKAINMEPECCEMWDWFQRANLPEPMFEPHLCLIAKLSTKRFYDGD